MKKTIAMSVMLALAPAAQAADIEAGKAKVAEVCAACHGANGVSVSDTIPNLAGQHAAYFASLPGATGPTAKSAQLPHVSKSSLTFPEGFKDSFVKYHSINFPATKQVRYYYANKAAVEAAKASKPLPDGSYLIAEVYAAKVDAAGKPVSSSDGLYVADKPLFYTGMGTGAGWGNGIPEPLRNGNWNYAVFTLDKKARPGVNQAECLACHKPLDSVSYTFTIKELEGAK